MGLPNIIIEFQSKASTAIKRGERGIVAVMVIETVAKPTVTKIEDITQIPEGLTETNRAYVERTFLGGQKPVKYVQLVQAATVDAGLPVLETFKFNYFAAPPNVTADDVTSIMTYFKALRDNKKLNVKAVLPNAKGDHEGIINCTTTDIKVGENTYTAAEYCSRVAGVFAGTPLSVSCTYFVLPEVDDVPKMSRSELDERIDAGELVLFHDGEKVKIGRERNSLTTVGQEKGDIYKSIKAVDIMDLIADDIHTTIEDNYIGKYANNYDNKCLIIVAVQTYLERLRDEQLLDTDITVGIDLEEQKKHLKERGWATDEMSEQEIKEANTETWIFIQGAYKILCAIEDARVRFNI